MASMGQCEMESRHSVDRMGELEGKSESQRRRSTLGNWDCMMWLNVATPDELEDFVWREIRKNQWVEATETHWAKQWF